MLDRRTGSPGVGDPGRQSRLVGRGTVVAVAVLIAACAVAGLAWTVAPPGRSSSVLGVLGWVLTAAGAAVQVIGIALVLRGLGAIDRHADPLGLLDRAQRKQLRHQLRGRAPLDPQRLGLVRWLARQEDAGRVHLLPGCGMATWFLAFGRDDGAARQVAGGVFALLCLGACGWGAFLARRARRFLAAHPEPAAVRR